MSVLLRFVAALVVAFVATSTTVSATEVYGYDAPARHWDTHAPAASASLAGEGPVPGTSSAALPASEATVGPLRPGHKLSAPSSSSVLLDSNVTTGLRADPSLGGRIGPAQAVREMGGAVR